jgi:hypothetical protein
MSKNKIHPLEEFGAAKGAIRSALASHSYISERMNALANCFPDDEALQSMAEVASKMLSEVNSFDLRLRRFFDQMRGSE